MQTFSLLGFAAHLAKIGVAIAIEEHLVLEHAAMIIEKEAKAEIGTYQAAAGPFAAWAPLADTTLKGWHGHPGKEALGYAPPDNPLLREGTMRDSIEHHVGDHVAEVGSNSDIAVFQELGTVHIPPRSFLGGAAFRKAPEVAGRAGMAVFAVLAGRGTTTKIV